MKQFWEKLLNNRRRNKQMNGKMEKQTNTGKIIGPIQ